MAGWAGALVALAAACGPVGEEPAAGSDGPVTVTTALGGLTAAELPRCDPLPPLYATVPDWVVDGLPEGMAFTVGKTDVMPPAEPSGASPRGTLLVSLDGDRLGPSIELVAGAPEPYAADASSVQPSDPPIAAVRGEPATVGTLVGRGAPPNRAMARWEAAGQRWLATSDSLDPGALVGVLDRLEINGDDVVDPQGQFTVLGSGPMVDDSGLPQRVTQLEVRLAGSTSGEERVFYLRIDPPVPGRTGPMTLPYGISEVVERGGRVTLVGPGGALSVTPDGWAVTVSTTNGDSQPVGLERSALDALLDGLRRRQSVEERAIVEVPVLPASAGLLVPDGFCLE